jgi:hypothetical protein
VVTVRNSQVPLSASCISGAITFVSFGGLLCLSLEFPLTQHGLPGPAIPFAALTWGFALLFFSPFIYDDDDVGSRSVTIVRRRIPFSPIRFAKWLRVEWREWKYANRHVVMASWWAFWLVILALAPMAIKAVTTSFAFLGPYSWIGGMLKGFLLVFAGLATVVSVGGMGLLVLIRFIFLRPTSNTLA